MSVRSAAVAGSDEEPGLRFPGSLDGDEPALLIGEGVAGEGPEGGGDLDAAGFRGESNLKSDKIGAKIRDAQLNKIPFMLVLGDKELEDKTIAVRERKQGDIGVMSLEEFKEMITQQKLLRAL